MEETAHQKAAALRLECAREIDSSRQSVDLAVAALRRSLPTIRSKAQAAISDIEKLQEIKGHLRDLEENLQKALSVKVSQEEKCTRLGDRISSTKARIKELQRIVQEQKIRRDEYAAIITNQLHAMEELVKKQDQDDNEKENIDEAISWYHRFLGFSTVGGDGVKFRFTKIDPNNTEREFSFTIRLDGDKYILLECNPMIKDLSKLVEELNHTNGLYQFARIMRGKFQALMLKDITLSESLPPEKDICQDVSTTFLSSPPSASFDSRLESVTGKVNADDAEQVVKERSTMPTRKNQLISCTKSPNSLPVRRSPRFLVRVVLI